MRHQFGPLRLTIRYTYPRPSPPESARTTIYQRAVPTDLRDRFPGATVKVDLRTTDPLEVAKMVEQLNRQYEAQWEALRASPESSTAALAAHADELLGRYGLTPGSETHDEGGLERFYDLLDNHRARHASGDEAAYREALPQDYLPPATAEAWRRLHREPRDTLTTVLEVHHAVHRKRDDTKFTTYNRRAFDALIAVTTDKEVAVFTREDGRRFIDAGLTKGLKTATIRRLLNVYRAAWSSYARERSPGLPNPFDSLAIPGEGRDKETRNPYTQEQLELLYAACQAKDDEPRWLLAMLIDTGARLAEVAGLLVSDIHTDVPVPYMDLRPHPWRSIKTDEARQVPLIGASLWGAERVVAMASKGQRFAFPRYTNEEACDANAASAALVKWVRGRGIDRVVHELRHSIKDRLREVECQKAIIDSITGHASQDVGDDYGHGYSLKVKGGWLQKVALKV